MTSTGDFTWEENGGTVSLRQHENGIYMAQILHPDGEISATTAATCAEAHAFIKEWVKS